MQSVRTWDFTPHDESGKEGIWSLDRIKAYHLQCIAVSLAEISRFVWRQSIRAEDEYKKRRAAEGALELQQRRGEIEELLNEQGSMPLHEFSAVLQRRRFRIHYPEDSIVLTDYLTLEPVGNGFRVRLIREETANA